mgnify:FL=1
MSILTHNVRTKLRDTFMYIAFTAFSFQVSYAEIRLSLNT